MKIKLFLKKIFNFVYPNRKNKELKQLFVLTSFNSTNCDQTKLNKLKTKRELQKGKFMKQGRNETNAQNKKR